jgi:hypothetical protein
LNGSRLIKIMSLDIVIKKSLTLMKFLGNQLKSKKLK